MLGSCIGVVVLAILYEGLKVLREYIDMKVRRDACRCGHIQESSDNNIKSTSTNNSNACIEIECRKQYVVYDILYVCMFVYVCLFARIPQKPYVQISLNFVCM